MWFVEPSEGYRPSCVEVVTRPDIALLKECMGLLSMAIYKHPTPSE